MEAYYKHWLLALAEDSSLLELTCTPPLVFHPWGIKSLLSCFPNAAEDLWSTDSVNPGYFSLRRKALFHSPPFSSIA